MDNRESAPSWRRDAALLLLAIGLFFCIGLGARPYLAPSEARYIEIPRQMLTSHDWLTPRINGVPYFEKPPLFYWMQASVMQWFGSGEFAGRSVTALMGTLTCLIVYAVGRLLYGRLSGLLAAGVLATSLLGYSLSRVAMLDMPVSLFITACPACFLAAQHMEDSRCRSRFYLLMYAASALAIMSKGLIGIVVPGMVIGAWIAITGRWRILKEAWLFTGLLLFLAITAPWHVLMAMQHPDFINFYFVHEHFTRFLTDEHKRTAPWWFFIAVTLAGLLPWTGLLPTAFRRVQYKEPNNLFLLLWIALPLLFYSSSHSKLIPYIFPIFPPLGLLLGQTLADYWQGNLPVKNLRLAILFVIILFTAVILGYGLLPAMPGKIGEKLATAEPIPFVMLLPMITALSGLAYALLSNRPAQTLIVAMMGFGAITGLSVNYLAARLDPATVKPLAAMLNERLHPDDMVVAYGSYWQDLPVYLNRNVTVAGWTGELSFGVGHYPETHEWMISTDEFRQRCAAAKHGVYVFINRPDYEKLTMPESCRLRMIANNGNTLLLERQNP